MAAEDCDYCGHGFCAGCWAWHELNGCSEKPAPDDVRVIGKATCVECGRWAERTCIQCGDNYCNWRQFGNPGCFEYYHRKGKKKSHRCRPHPRPALVKVAMFLQTRYRGWKGREAVVQRKREYYAIVVQRRWRFYWNRREGWHVFRKKRSIGNALLRGFGRARRRVRDTRDQLRGVTKENKLSKRQIVFEAVMKKYDDAQPTAKELKTMIKYEIK